ncbi:hypothetical protein D8674_035077 [Pyrus ussuriensis x Pyrus communis]|uniref:Uncharacterized protein n=1 Tax=Pyrus ussuriensis x Pyrus communis TaxID=2448454 RepID=A0A5N5GG09_9ROSA|nr:hypothetical protein D8674_035077 [Pyrus ussuriensis x Pyrus communis]
MTGMGGGAEQGSQNHVEDKEIRIDGDDSEGTKNRNYKKKRVPIYTPGPQQRNKDPLKGIATLRLGKKISNRARVATQKIEISRQALMRTQEGIDEKDVN